MSSKICTKCGRDLPSNDTYYFKDKKMKDGLFSSCKECNGYRFTKAVSNVIREGYKICTECKIEYPATNEFFHKKKNGAYGLRSVCIKCAHQNNKQRWNDGRLKEYNKKYLKNNLEKVIEYRKQYRVKHSEKIKEYHRKRYVENKEIISAQHKIWRDNNTDKIKKANKIYYENNYLDYQIRTEIRRKQIKKSIITLTKKDWKDSIKYFNSECAYCGKHLKRLTQEHIIAVSKGGNYVKQNIIPACKSCNSSKNNRDMEEWYKKQPFFSEERLSKIYKWMGIKENIQQLKII